MFTLDATDEGCGVNVTRYRIDGGPWTDYVGGFTLAAGVHHVSHASADRLGNPEPERGREVAIPVSPPSVETNWKPLVALVFALVLLLVGWWSSKRRPWRGGTDPMAVAKAFLLTAFPFVLAEVATGLVSHVTGALSIPPGLGAGTVVDAGILLAGLVVALVHGRSKKGGSSTAGVLTLRET